MTEFIAGFRDFIHGDKFEKFKTLTQDFDKVSQQIREGKIVPIARVEHLLDVLTDPESEVDESEAKQYRDQLRKLMQTVLDSHLLTDEKEIEFYQSGIKELTEVTS